MTAVSLLRVSASTYFPGRFQPSIFGANELNFCVRDGNRWDLIAINTDYGDSCGESNPRYRRERPVS